MEYNRYHGVGGLTDDRFNQIGEFCHGGPLYSAVGFIGVHGMRSRVARRYPDSVPSES